MTVGLFTEAVIFFFSAFEPLHEEVDWTLVYPELAGVTEEEPGMQGRRRRICRRSAAECGGAIGGSSGGGAGSGSYALSKFDEMLESADITPELFQKLGVGMKRFSEVNSNLRRNGRYFSHIFKIHEYDPVCQ